MRRFLIAVRVARRQRQCLAVVLDGAVVVADLAIGHAAIVEGDGQRLGAEVAGQNRLGERLDRGIVAAFAEGGVAVANVAHAVGVGWRRDRQNGDRAAGEQAGRDTTKHPLSHSLAGEDARAAVRRDPVG